MCAKVRIFCGKINKYVGFLKKRAEKRIFFVKIVLHIEKLIYLCTIKSIYKLK